MLESEHLTRQSDLIPMTALDTPITVIGAGAIGSFTTLALAKMGFHDITVFDDDTVSIVNMSNQFFRFSDIDKPKVLALAEIVKDFANVEITAYNLKYEGKHMLKGVVICALDSMAARKMVFDALAERSLAVKLVIDARMSAESVLLFTYKPMNEKECESYKKTLYSDESAVQERCTAKSTMYCVLSVSSLVAGVVKQFVTGGKLIKRAEWDVCSADITTFMQGEEHQRPTKAAYGVPYATTLDGVQYDINMEPGAVNYVWDERAFNPGTIVVPQLTDTERMQMVRQAMVQRMAEETRRDLYERSREALRNAEAQAEISRPRF